MRLRVVDFETTGAQGSEVIEAAFVDLERVGVEWRVGLPTARLFRPCGGVSVHARAVHHIRDADLHSAEASSVEAVERFLSQGAAIDAFVAHHAEFERSFLPSLRSAQWICTAKSARRAWPQAVGHSNQVLRYWLDLQLDPALALPAHRAGPDAYVTAHILQQLLLTETADTLIDWTTQPSVVSFGKHKGQPWSEVPSGYLHWMMTENDMADRHRQRAQNELKRREANNLVEVAQ
ncbi:MAG TPA: hypothetical protein VGR32_04970 [Brevundimonas sp.]|jgi:exodeoxyribonuclease X|uniref:hypothetical protein n=1 Tax=Brevundimonas sp. TaxID=1871086 RepID=UPI002DEB6ECF|nr:hypothetical protein [Brevundimonas sp.]